MRSRQTRATHIILLIHASGFGERIGAALAVVSFTISNNLTWQIARQAISFRGIAMGERGWEADCCGLASATPFEGRYGCQSMRA